MFKDSKGNILNQGDKVSIGDFFEKGEESIGIIEYDNIIKKLIIKGDDFECDIEKHRKAGHLKKL